MSSFSRKLEISKLFILFPKQMLLFWPERSDCFCITAQHNCPVAEIHFSSFSHLRLWLIKQRHLIFSSHLKHRQDTQELRLFGLSCSLLLCKSSCLHWCWKQILRFTRNVKASSSVFPPESTFDRSPQSLVH